MKSKGRHYLSFLRMLLIPLRDAAGFMQLLSTYTPNFPAAPPTAGGRCLGCYTLAVAGRIRPRRSFQQPRPFRNTLPPAKDFRNMIELGCINIDRPPRVLVFEEGSTGLFEHEKHSRSRVVLFLASWKRNTIGLRHSYVARNDPNSCQFTISQNTLAAWVCMSLEITSLNTDLAESIRRPLLGAKNLATLR